MDLTPLDQAFIDPSKPFRKSFQPEVIIPPKKSCVIEEDSSDNESDSNEAPIIRRKCVKKEADDTGFTCTHCKKINWYNIIIMALLIYIIFKK